MQFTQKIEFAGLCLNTIDEEDIYDSVEYGEDIVLFVQNFTNNFFGYFC
jgi:hypothetical protein